MEKEIERIVCEADDGTAFTIIAIQEYRFFNALSGSTTPVKGLKRLELLDGSSYVNFIDERHFKIVDTGQIVRRI